MGKRTGKKTADAAGAAALPFPPPRIFPPSRILRALFLTFVLGSLAACAGSEPRVSEEAATAQAAVPPPSLPKPAPKPLPDPGVVMGLSTGGVTALLGPPDYRRRDKPAEIWQYRNASCVLDLFLYSTDGAPAKVNHMDFRRLGRSGTDKDKTGPGDMSDRECFQGFLRDRSAQKKG